jgi:hypothetical protein
MNTIRERWYRYFVWWWIFAFIGASFLQFYSPEMVASHTIWGYAPGWQHEIAIWNVFAIMVLIGVLRARIPLGKTVIPATCVLFTLLATNHLLAVVQDPENHGYLIVILNYVPLLAVAILRLVTRRRKLA